MYDKIILLPYERRGTLSRKKSTEELRQHQERAIGKMNDYMSSLIESNDTKTKGKGDKLSYWLEDWTTFLNYEPEFNPIHLRRYKRGEIIKVHLGFNIGSEEGGLHYAVVLDKSNPKSSPVLTIVPLTSLKQNQDIKHLKSGNIFLGNELFTSLQAKYSSTLKHLEEEISLLQEMANSINFNIGSSDTCLINRKLEHAKNESQLLKRMSSEIMKMKKGSIALVNQITTISKIRIYDPKTDHDILSNVKLSNEKLDLIDDEIRKKFTNF